MHLKVSVMFPHLSDKTLIIPKNLNKFSISIFLLQNFPQSHQLITTLNNGNVPTTQTVTTTGAFNNILASAATTTNSYTISQDEINKKLPKEILLRILSYLDVVSLCRCAQVN